jgi:hypothetical protein
MTFLLVWYVCWVLLRDLCSRGLLLARKRLAVQEDPECRYLKETMSCGQDVVVDAVLHLIALRISIENRLLISACEASEMCHA